MLYDFTLSIASSQERHFWRWYTMCQIRLAVRTDRYVAIVKDNHFIVVLYIVPVACKCWNLSWFDREEKHGWFKGSVFELYTCCREFCGFLTAVKAVRMRIPCCFFSWEQEKSHLVYNWLVHISKGQGVGNIWLKSQELTFCSGCAAA